MVRFVLPAVGLETQISEASWPPWDSVGCGAAVRCRGTAPRVSLRSHCPGAVVRGLAVPLVPHPCLHHKLWSYTAAGPGAPAHWCSWESSNALLGSHPALFFLSQQVK